MQVWHLAQYSRERKIGWRKVQLFSLERSFFKPETNLSTISFSAAASLGTGRLTATTPSRLQTIFSLASGVISFQGGSSS